MVLEFLIKGAIVGFSIAAPIGPISVLCIKRTFDYGRLSGLFSGIGAACGATCYGAIATFGLTLVSDIILNLQVWMRLIGGAFLIYLGIKTFLSKSLQKPKIVSHKTLVNDLISTFFLTLVNPMTIISYLAIFAGLDIATTHGQIKNAIFLVIGIFIGAMTWWIIVAEGLTLLKDRLTQQMLRLINKVAGSIIVGFGFFAWCSIIKW